MKKVSFGLLSLLTALSLVGCSRDDETTTLKVGATAVPHAEIRKMNIISSEKLREMYVGDWENKKFDDIIEKLLI